MKLTDATLLIAEDEPQIRSILAEWFERQHCRVLMAANGAEALEIMQSQRVHLLMSDVRMPVMDGIALAARIQSMEHYTPKIMFISGFGDIFERDSYDLGIEVTLSKPFRRAEVIAAAKRCLADNVERWREPAQIEPRNTLQVQFDSVREAGQSGLISFGRGGFCVRSRLGVASGDPLRLNLLFSAEGRAVTGVGVVRWTALAEEQLGVEIIAVDRDALEWTASLCASTETRSFIPRTSKCRVALS